MRFDRRKDSFKLLAGTVIILLVAVTCKVGGQLDGSKAKNYHITVGPDPCTLTENGQPQPKQRLSMMQRNWIVWQSDGGQPLYLVFHVPADCEAPPFLGMTLVGKDPAGNNLYQLGDGTQDMVFSGPIHKKACKGKEIKYDQHLGDKHCDGMIIIEP